MRFLPATLVAVVAMATTLLDAGVLFAVQAKKPSRTPRPSGRRPGTAGGVSGSRSSSSRQAPVSRRRVLEEEDDVEEDEDDLGFSMDLEEEEEDGVYGDEEEQELAPPTRRSASSRRPPPASSRNARAPPSRKRPSRPTRVIEEEDEYDDEYTRPRSRGPAKPTKRGTPPSSRRGPPPRSGRGGRPAGRPGSVVPYGKQSPGAAATFTKGITAFRNSLPDPSAVREAVGSSLSVARQTTSGLTANIYREVKGLTSSELEQVMLKATRPDDTPVKGKHVERLVGVTYQISPRYDIYDAVLRKLWGKMAEKDWRTTIKSLYILHRFSADGAPEHAAALKARLRELRRTRDPKRKDKYFNSKQLLAGESNPENIKFRAFMSRYAHYVLLRAQCFGGLFDEISQEPKLDKKKPPKAITTTSLRSEHLEAAAMLLKAGVACQLKEDEACENTAIAAERVASDLIGLTTSVAIALNRALKSSDLKGGDPELLKKWCEFYSEELLPQTRAMVKKTSSKLDAYGLFLPSRMGASLSPEMLQKGLNLEGKSLEPDEATEVEDEPVVATESREDMDATDEPEARDEEAADEVVEEEAEFDDEYEYEEEEYYDDEEE
jgi:hypothetical protein